MISLEFGVPQMLAEIGANEDVLAHALDDPADPRLLEGSAAVVLGGEEPDDVLPALNDLFRRRFPEVPAETLENDLLRPLKKGVGNAWRRGNLKEPGKRIIVKVALTPRGTFVAVHDQGAGFDFAEVHRLFLSPTDEKYFTRKGGGFAKFEKANSRISWADGGRTFLLRFLAAGEPGRKPSKRAAETLPSAALDPDLMKARLDAPVRAFAPAIARVDSCAVFVPDERKNEAWDVKYRLEVRDEAGAGSTLLLTGRVLERDAARREATAARQWARLAGANEDGLAAPPLVAELDDPSMVVYAIDPSSDLRDVLKKDPPPAAMAKILDRVAHGLRDWHRSDFAPGTARPFTDEVRALHDAADRIAATLDGFDPAIATRLREFSAAFRRESESIGSDVLAPVHGDFGLHRVLAADGTLWVSGFEHARGGHPGFDLGGFLADLLRHAIHEDGAGQGRDFEAWRTRFIASYGAGAPPPWLAGLRCFVAAGLLSRLDRLMARAPKSWQPKVGGLVELCAQSLANEGNVPGR